MGAGVGEGAVTAVARTGSRRGRNGAGAAAGGVMVLPRARRLFAAVGGGRHDRALVLAPVGLKSSRINAYGVTAWFRRPVAAPCCRFGWRAYVTSPRFSCRGVAGLVRMADPPGLCAPCRIWL